MSSKNLTIGTDPELVLVEKKAGIETPVFVRNYVPGNGKFGADGHGYIAELRPEHATSPKDLSEHLQQTLASGYTALGAFDWRASPWVLEKPCGGHIHFGTKLTQEIADSLNNLGAIVLGLVEPPIEAAKRRSTPLAMAGGTRFNNGGKPYGLLGDLKSKPYGFEWRTPSSFIVSPGITTGIFALSKAIVFESVIEGKHAWHNLPDSARKELTVKKGDFERMNRQAFVDKIQPFQRLVRNLRYFKMAEGKEIWSNVAYLFRHTVPKGGYPVRKDIKKIWGAEDLAKHVTQANGDGPLANRGWEVGQDLLDAAAREVPVRPRRPRRRTLAGNIQPKRTRLPADTLVIIIERFVQATA
jgi:hypothetical protein